MPSRRRARNDLRFQVPNLKSHARPQLPAARCLLPTSRRGFTLLELLVVIGIIVLLAAILVPVVSQVRMKGYVTTTEAQMQRIAAAIESYYHDFKAYPGPIANGSLSGWTPAKPIKMNMAPSVSAPIADPTKITSTENLVLGLFGLLNPPDSSDPSATVVYSGFPPKHDVLSLNPVRPAAYHYIDYIPEELSVPSGYAYSVRTGSMTGSGQLPTDVTESGGTNTPTLETVGSETAIPEFMDRIPEYMPILYIRANVGVQPQPGVSGSGIASQQVPPTTPVQYDASQLAFYGFTKVSYDTSGKGDYVMPQGVTASAPDDQWVAYFMNPNVVGQPRGKDGFVLISAGADRVYGTKDDIIVTP